ncbi:hypothetical protein PV341_07690 [Streptomyces sp. PA03-1a]|nr:hypothetical protein [Streptomyces sp. PA03-1a]
MKVDLDVTFTAFDSSSANGFSFEDWCDIWEEDDSDDDLVTRGTHHNIAPRNAGFTISFTNIASDKLDTELGGEEVYARCFVRNKETGTQPASYSSVIQLSPG